MADWIHEVTAIKASAERTLRQSTSRRMEEDDVRSLVHELGNLVRVLEIADSRLKGEIYSTLGVRLEYRPKKGEVRVDLKPACAGERVGGVSATFSTRSEKRGVKGKCVW